MAEVVAGGVLTHTNRLVVRDPFPDVLVLVLTTHTACQLLTSVMVDRCISGWPLSCCARPCTVQQHIYGVTHFDSKAQREVLVAKGVRRCSGAVAALHGRDVRPRWLARPAAADAIAAASRRVEAAVKAELHLILLRSVDCRGGVWHLLREAADSEQLLRAVASTQHSQSSQCLHSTVVMALSLQPRECRTYRSCKSALVH
jgi:hypothetical protein